MHPSSYDRMAEFARDYLGGRENEALSIVDLGSCDYNGTYRPLFAEKRWRYIGVDLTPGPNVDLILRDPYHWKELKSGSIDVVVSGQTFEHTEYFWETMLEITRILKPGGLCCIIAPASGDEHRFSLDCWRMYSDGCRAVARYAGLEVLQAHTHWEELAKYNDESNKWHDSILVARKRPESLGEKIRRRLSRAARRRLHPLPRRDEMLIQIFHSADGIHREQASVVAGVEQGDWREVQVKLLEGAGARPLRIDFMRTLEFVEIAALKVTTANREYFSATTAEEFDQITVAGDAERLPHSEYFRLRITGIDPQLVLPVLETGGDAGKLRVDLRLRVFGER